MFAALRFHRGGAAKSWSAVYVADEAGRRKVGFSSGFAKCRV